ncbi:MAG: InlB B-repeat-containing protein, partial [Bacilli bacterium]|nr:InlB B-repeat-containing protein [Bacilli bacterium]
FAHYGDYLYSDTYKWAKEGWIDYLLPQSYWAFEHPSAGYADVMDWWNKAFEGLDCLLYSGIGIYMANESGNTYSWKYNYQELTNQLKYLTKLENVSGYSIYKYSYMKMAYEDQNKATTFQVNNAVKAGCFDDVALYPEIKTMTPVVLEAVKDLKFSENTLSFSKDADAKAYAIYKSDKELTFDNSEIVALIGGEDMTITWVDENPGAYNYGVRAISGTNTLGEKAVAEIEKPVTPTYTVTFTDGDGHVLLIVEVEEGASVKAPEDPTKEGYKFVGWDQEFDNVTENLVVNPIFEKVEVDNPTPPVEPSDPTPPTPNEKGCKKELSMVIIGLISIVTLGIITLKKER